MADQQQIFSFLATTNWDEVSRRVLAYTISLAQNRRWRGQIGGVDKSAELTNGVSCEDIVQQLIEKTIKGERKWDPDKGELEPWLCAQVKSAISHLIESSVHKHERADVSEELDNRPATAVVASSSARFAVGTEIIVLREIDAAAKVAAIYDVTADDPEVEELVTAILDGCESKPRMLAQQLGTDVQDINNRLKRLRRRVVEVRRT